MAFTKLNLNKNDGNNLRLMWSGMSNLSQNRRKDKAFFVYLKVNHHHACQNKFPENIYIFIINNFQPKFKRVNYLLLFKHGNSPDIAEELNHVFSETTGIKLEMPFQNVRFKQAE